MLAFGVLAVHVETGITCVARSLACLEVAFGS
jgi:hypothetical protein